ncbi:uroporphyrinogen decarboxylase [Rickettsiales bacterium]|nr:uroporphyrinogen decarboxylase [Rickettsiales bacterium]
MLIKSLLLTKKKQNNKIPIWFMRQAGRYLPEYRKIRLKKKNFLDLCFSPKLAATISLQPIERFDLDAIILFSDILVVPYALGQKVSFKEKIGPILQPVKNVKDLKFQDNEEWNNYLTPVYETIDILKLKKKNKTLIGFCGSPFTVFTYMIEGGTSTDHKKTKLFLKTEPQKAQEIIDLLVNISIHYLSKQIDAGVDVIQLFESWSSLLQKKQYDDFIISPNKKIIDALKKKYPNNPIIVFPRNSEKNTEKLLNSIKCDGLSIDLKTPKKIIKICEKKKIIIQGRLDPIRLLRGGKQLEEKIHEDLEIFKTKNYIFNLSHGILPETPISNVEKMIKIVRNYEIT